MLNKILSFVGGVLVKLGSKILDMRDVRMQEYKGFRARDAGGTKGVLLLQHGGKVLFRVYGEGEDGFVDYDLYHNDLAVIIEPGYEAAFYINDNGEVGLDHAPQTLGVKYEY